MVVNFSARFYYSIMSIADRIFYALKGRRTKRVLSVLCPALPWPVLPWPVLSCCLCAANAATVVTFCAAAAVVVVVVVVRFSLL